ncbi:uncharacterized protein LOC101850603 [Aplysia californica]|uniref:Uncharacterized protein LOC101850603 n=1 Tax=Aplysia californica TaxID=6500 RepID=A0ABM0K6E9_APLCA|nr:uncharacterized protein LOC101850603 [Aplysia californica]
MVRLIQNQKNQAVGVIGRCCCEDIQRQQKDYQPTEMTPPCDSVSIQNRPRIWPSKEQLPRNLRATSIKSFLWVSAAHLRSPYSGLVTITNDPWCLSLQVLDQTRTNAYTPADFFSAYTDFEESQYDLTYDCFGRSKEKMVLTHSESSTTTLSFHR